MKQPKGANWVPPGTPGVHPLSNANGSAGYSVAIGTQIDPYLPPLGYQSARDRMFQHQMHCEDCYWHPFDGKGWKVDSCPTGMALEALEKQAQKLERAQLLFKSDPWKDSVALKCGNIKCNHCEYEREARLCRWCKDD